MSDVNEWSEPINYPGRCTDIVGQVVGPNIHNEHYVISEANYRSDLDLTECRLVLMGKGTERHVTHEAQDAYIIQRMPGMSAQLGYDMRNDMLPAAFRRDIAPPPPKRVSTVMMPGPMGRELALNGG